MWLRKQNNKYTIDLVPKNREKMRFCLKNDDKIIK